VQGAIVLSMATSSASMPLESVFGQSVREGQQCFFDVGIHGLRR
jgi:hypothetical protein